MDAPMTALPTLSAPSVTLRVAPNAGVRFASDEISGDDVEVDVSGEGEVDFRPGPGLTVRNTLKIASTGNMTQCNIHCADCSAITITQRTAASYFEVFGFHGKVQVGEEADSIKFAANGNSGCLTDGKPSTGRFHQISHVDLGCTNCTSRAATLSVNPPAGSHDTAFDFYACYGGNMQ